MFYIDKLTGEVSLTRGDDALFTLHINQGSNLDPLQYKLKEKDRIYFAIEEPNQPFENAIVKKVIDLENNLLDKNGNITFELVPEDTVLLMPGLYYYEIKAKLYRGNSFRNAYLVLKLDAENYSIIDEEHNSEVLSNGTYNVSDNNYTFTEAVTNKQYQATLNEDKLTFGECEDKDFSNLTFKQEKDIVNTIIQQTKFTVER